jgi:hypothetical protein
MQPALPVQQVEPVEQVEQVEQADTAEPDVAELKQTVQALKAQLAKSTGRIAQLEKEVAETAPRPGVDADDGPLAEGTDLAAMVAQLRAEKAALLARSRTWAVAGAGAIIGLIVFMVLLVPATRRAQSAKADAPEIAPTAGTGKIDEGNLIHQLAETLGVEEATVAMPQLSPAPSGSLVPASPAEGAAEERKNPQRADVAPAVPLALAAPAASPAAAAGANNPGT